MTNLVSKLFFHRFSPYILFVANLIFKLIFLFQSRNSVAMPPYNFHQAHNRAFQRLRCWDYNKNYIKLTNRYVFLRILITKTNLLYQNLPLEFFQKVRNEAPPYLHQTTTKNTTHTHPKKLTTKKKIQDNSKTSQKQHKTQTTKM